MAVIRVSLRRVEVALKVGGGGVLGKGEGEKEEAICDVSNSIRRLGEVVGGFWRLKPPPGLGLVVSQQSTQSTRVNTHSVHFVIKGRDSYRVLSSCPADNRMNSQCIKCRLFTACCRVPIYDL